MSDLAALRPSETDPKPGDRASEEPWPEPKAGRKKDKEGDGQTSEADPESTPDPIGKDPGEGVS